MQWLEDFHVLISFILAMIIICFLCHRFLGQTVKDFVAQVGAISAASNPEEASDPESLTHKCVKLQQKLSLLLRTLKIESDASKMFDETPKSPRRKSFEDLDEVQRSYTETKKQSLSGRWHSESDIHSDDEPRREPQCFKKGKPRCFIPKEHLWSRANSLKKAMREIISHTEQGKLL